METNRILVELFTIPQEACDADKTNWLGVAQMVQKQLTDKFADKVEFKHIEFMSDDWFKHCKALKFLTDGNVFFPFALVDGQIASFEKKVNISKINRVINQKLQP